MTLYRSAKKGAAWALVFLLGLAAGWWGARSLWPNLRASMVARAAEFAAAFSPAEIRDLQANRSDLARPAYQAVRERLARLQGSNPHVRLLYLVRYRPSDGQVQFLADSRPPRSGGAILPGALDADALRSSSLQRAIHSGLPGVDAPAAGAAAPVALAFAPISLAAGDNDMLGAEITAPDLETRSLLRGGGCALAVWILLGVPLAGWFVARRNRDQRSALRNLLTAMDQSQSAVMIINLGGRIEYANSGLVGQLGYSRREVIGRVWRDLLPPETPPALLAELEACVRAGRPWNGEWVNRRKDGELFPVRGTATPVKSRRGRPAGFVAVFDDMTEIRRSEGTLRAALERAESGDRTKSRFLATMSHEVRTPLNGIVGFTGLLMETSLTAEQSEYVQTIRTSGEALIQLTSDILDFARIESGGMKLELQPTNPRSCVEDTLDLLAVQAVGKGIELLHWVDSDVPAVIMADDSRLRQVLVNLVNNAVKFTEKGLVEVSLTAKKTEPTAGVANWILRFSVRDSGIGIAPEHGELLFKPFRQVDESTTRRHGGTGLGLAISKNLVELMGGDIGFRSAPERGSVFTFTVPAPEVAGMTRTVPSLGRLRVALAAPAGPFRDEFRRLIESWGAEFVEREAPERLEAPGWDIAFADMDEAAARGWAERAPAWPADRCYGVIPVSLAADLRVGLRPKFVQLLNKPLHHDSLASLLAGFRPASVGRPVPRAFGLNVLVVEDNLVNQRLVQKLLSNLGCRATVAVNGRLALELLTTAPAPFDVVLMDLHMPELDGLGAIEKIRAGEAGQAARSVWVTVLTADARASQKEKVVAAGSNDYLVKPVSLTELAESLERYNGARRTNSSGA